MLGAFQAIAGKPEQRRDSEGKVYWVLPLLNLVQVPENFGGRILMCVDITDGVRREVSRWTDAAGHMFVCYE